MSLRRIESNVVPPDEGSRGPRSPGKVTSVQRYGLRAASPSQTVQRAIDPSSAAVQRSRLDHDLAAACGYVGGPAESPDASARLGVQGAGSATVQRKAVNTTTTPTDPPPALPAATHAATGPHTDAEGNTISLANGHWYLVDDQPETGTAHKWKGWAGRKLELVPINPDASFTALRAAAETIRTEQFALAETLKQGASDRGAYDQKYWFAKVYAHVTVEELKMVDGGHYEYPHMKLQEVIHFYRTYRANLDAWMNNAVAGTKSKVEAHWAKAFASAEAEAGHTAYKPESLEIFHAMLPSMQAHIRFDLPRSVATVFQLHYAGIPGVSLADFKTDFDNMMPVFDRAGAVLTTEIGGIAPTASPLYPFMFEIAGEREQTWEKATMLSNQMEANAGRSSKTVSKSFEKAAKSALTAAHPNSSADAFSVDGDNFEGAIDWTNQPGKQADAKGPGDAFEPGKPAPAFPSKIFFKKDRPTASDKLEDAIRDDQELAPYLALADWSREVRGATVTIDAHASAEGDGADNFALSVRRATLVRDFLTACGADWVNNTLVLVPASEIAAAAEEPAWRFARIKVLLSGTSRQLQHLANRNLPSEVAKR